MDEVSSITVSRTVMSTASGLYIVVGKDPLLYIGRSGFPDDNILFYN